MKANVKAKMSDAKYLPIRADEFISKHKTYNVDCKISERNLGFLATTYDLCLEGKNEDIESFISYLKMKGFKVKKF